MLHLTEYPSGAPRSSLAILDDLALILAEWETLSREEPWHIDPHRYGIDSLHEVIAAILESTGEPQGRACAEVCHPVQISQTRREKVDHRLGGAGPRSMIELRGSLTAFAQPQRPLENT